MGMKGEIRIANGSVGSKLDGSFFANTGKIFVTGKVQHSFEGGNIDLNDE
jgi:hypothetical protein